jgi:hypothetical protein
MPLNVPIVWPEDTNPTKNKRPASIAWLGIIPMRTNKVIVNPAMLVSCPVQWKQQQSVRAPNARMVGIPMPRRRRPVRNAKKVKNKGLPKQFHVSNVVLVLFPTMQPLLLVILVRKAGSVQRKVPRNVLPVRRVGTTINRPKHCPAIVHGAPSIRFPRQYMHLNPRPVFLVPMANLLRPTGQSLKIPVKCSTYKWCLLRRVMVQNKLWLMQQRVKVTVIV